MFRPFIPKIIPKSIQKEIDSLKKCTNQEVCLKNAYDLLTTKFKGYKFLTYLMIHELFIFDLDWLWSKYLIHCTHLNQFLEILLVRSGHFKESDIKPKWTLFYYVSPHQYLRIKVGQKWMNIDIWGGTHGVAFGRYAHGFGSK